MKKLLKKSIVGLTFILVLLLVVSSVNASNNDTEDIVSVETDETVSIEESSYDSDEFASTVEMLEDESDDALSSVKDDEICSFEENDNVLGVNLPPYTAYNVKIDHVEKDNNEYTIYTFISDVSHGYDEDYVFDMNFYDSNDVLKASGRFHGTYSYPSLIGRTIDANQLEQGIYTIKLVNYVDKHVMDTAELVIGPTYVDNKYKNVNINAPNAYYNQNKKISYSFEGNFKGSFNIYKDNSLKYSKKIDTSGYMDGIFKYNKHSYTYAISNLKDIGKYVVKIVDSTGKVIAQSTFEITKSPTRSISFDFSTKKGSKETIYLHVYDNDWNDKGINGKAKIKIGSKTYTTKVKNGFAQIKVKFPSKVKTYKCSAQFLGNDFYKSSSEKFTIRVEGESSDIYVDSFIAKPGKKCTIKAKVFGRYDGKKIKNGVVKFKINGKTYKTKIKNGIAKITIKTPNKAKIYNCKATHVGNKKIKGSSTKFTITVKKNAKKITKTKTITKTKNQFTVVVPVKLNKECSKNHGSYSVKTFKYTYYDYYGVKHSHVDVLVYKKGKLSSNFKAKYVAYTDNGKTITVNVNGNYWRATSSFNNILNIYKVKATVWV